LLKTLKEVKMKRKLTLVSAASIAVLPVFVPIKDASAVPAFARKYGTSCYTCHSGFPARNAFGEAFKNNGYPGQEERMRISQSRTRLSLVQMAGKRVSRARPGRPIYPDMLHLLFMLPVPW
jgi:hypothetical protein